MAKVMSNYFDEAHKNLSRHHSEPGLIGFQGPKLHTLSSSTSFSVQLPPLRSPAKAEGPNRTEKTGNDKIAFFQMSDSQEMTRLSSYEFSQENAKLLKKVGQLQEQLSIVSAKKEAFKAQSSKLEKELKKGNDQSELLQRELVDAKGEIGQLSRESQEAMQIVAEMRQAHIHEVRLLQRGLQRQNGDSQNKNRVNEMADLVDKLGRAVIQRDEAVRDKTKMQAQLQKLEGNLRATASECAALKKQNRQLQASLKEAQRRVQYVPPRLSKEQVADSDEEFEMELQAFEKRFQILEEGPAGLDILASNLSRDKRELEKQLKQEQESQQALNNATESWKATCAEKEKQIQDLNDMLERIQKDQAIVQEQIANKRKEIEVQVEEEKNALMKRIRDLEEECDNARAAADGMEKASDRLSRELAKVHQQYNPATAGPSSKAPAQAAAGAGAGAAGDEEEEPRLKSRVTLDVQGEEAASGSSTKVVAEEGAAPPGDENDMQGQGQDQEAVAAPGGGEDASTDHLQGQGQEEAAAAPPGDGDAATDGVEAQEAAGSKVLGEEVAASPQESGAATDALHGQEEIGYAALVAGEEAAAAPPEDDEKGLTEDTQGQEGSGSSTEVAREEVADEPRGEGQGPLVLRPGAAAEGQEEPGQREP